MSAIVVRARETFACFWGTIYAETELPVDHEVVKNFPHLFYLVAREKKKSRIDRLAQGHE